MPTSDAIFFALGLADYAFVLVFVVVTGFVSRRERQEAEKQKLSEAGK
jgi:uncharacterized membrane protein